MRTVSQRYFSRQVVLIMVWFVNRLYSLLDWLWRRLGFLWRCFTRISASIVGRTLLAIGFRRSDPGNQAEPEENDENKPPETRSLEEGEGVYCEGQHEVSAGERVVRQRPEPEEEDDDDDDDNDDDDDAEEYRVDATDEFYCDYDSTWETEESQEGTFNRTNHPATSRHYKFNRFRDAARDMQNYRHGYPFESRTRRRNRPVSDDKPNLKFYLGVRPSSPDGVYISDFHTAWYGEYDTLEYVHTYIQWLFPLQEPGMNCDASTLTKAEIEDFLKNTTAKQNLLMSYKLMLDFYGIELCNEETGDVRRAFNWRDRFNNLNSHTHNNLRITRILKCLGTLGYHHYQAPLVHFFLEETLVHGELPRVKDSVLSYFVFAVLDKRQRRKLIKFAYLNYDHRDEFVWCPKKIQMKWSPKDFELDIDLEYLNLGRKDEVEASEAAKAESVW